MTGAAIAAKLDEARKLIEAGWCREDFDRTIAGKRHYCALGAISAAAPGYGFFDLKRAVENAAGVRHLAEWNDAQKSKRPVIAAFRKAADLARAEQSA